MKPRFPKTFIDKTITELGYCKNIVIWQYHADQLIYLPLTSHDILLNLVQ